MLKQLQRLVEQAEDSWIFELAKPFGSPGGKRGHIGYLTQAMPKHKTYVEPYAGGASLFFAKEPSEVEVLNDLHKEIIETYKFIRDGSESDFEKFRQRIWTPSEALFKRLKGSNPQSQVEMVYKHLYLTRHSIRRGKDSFEASKSDSVNFLKNLEKLKERLAGVKIHSEDALKIVKKYDAPDTFFYLDPPWIKLTGWFGDFNEDAFFEKVQGLRGKCLINFQGEKLKDKFKGAQWHLKTITVPGAGFLGATKQHVASNYSWSMKRG